jgi:predicted dehydrogenase
MSESFDQFRQRDRRLFLKSNVATFAAATWGASALGQEATSPNEKIRLGVMGVNGRGASIAQGMIETGQVEIAYICDVDSRARERVTKFVAEKQSTKPEAVDDFRKILDDPKVDVLTVAAPNHWHAVAAILGCQAGKHVYVEKPCSHTPEEGELAIAAARKHDRIVQMGTQRRSWPGLIEGVSKLHAGQIGKVLYARTWYNNRRPSIGHGKPASVPEWLDWELWQGPSTRKPFKDNVLHYNWHWHWHWGNGELGNNGVHGLDVARWGLDVTFPHRVSAGGGKYRHDDDQDTPDTMVVTFDFDHSSATWEGLSWSPLGPHDDGFGVSFHGTEGTLVMRDAGYVIYDMKNKELSRNSGDRSDGVHFLDFLDAIRTNRLPHADIEQGHRSTLLCHLGNIAYRVGRTLHTDPTNGHILNDPEAAQFWSKEYAPGWEPKVC